MAATQLSESFWRLFAIFIKKLCKEASFSSPSAAVQQLEGQVLPLLDRLDFLTQCRNLQALETILSSLHDAGYQLPLSTIQALSADLLFKALIRPRPSSPSSAISVASDLKSTRLLFDFVKRSLNCSFSDLREAMASALSKVTPFKEADDVLQTRLCLLEEEFCWGICDENRLLQHVLEHDEHISNKEPYAASHTEPSLPAEEGSRLAGFMRRGLQSQYTDARLQTVKLAVACSFHSYIAFSKFFPLLQTALYLEDFEFRQYVLAALMDLVYMHQKKLTFGAVSHLILPFLYAPTSGLQLVAVIGCGRLLLYDCFPEETECLLSAMIERYVYDPYVLPSDASNNSHVKLEAVVKAMHCFFQEYSGGKKLHQDEIANALVYMCLEKVEEGVVLLEQGANEQETYMKDNPERAEESRRLHLALHFGLSISESTLDALLDSLVLNINEQRRAVHPSHQVPTSLLTRKACWEWLLKCSS